MVKNLRPREAAQALGIGLSTFWLKAKTDPDFPQLISLGPKATVVREADLEAYVEKKAQAGKPTAPPTCVPRNGAGIPSARRPRSARS
ncbi:MULTISPECIES: helix-turn-helix transcriptional regulator [Ramlibacter]|uniref:AlpA family phage regulatory protein n=1 Tax=Ramlibacter pinisoli TaxID=2682844 RepID=A0A6N8ITV5_9BURK|nr:AlpA family phage regulatory protein [Ramlibacter pinisoli]MBA2964990.1 AlpA family phage regulatory protein [Ramlibacter sp. CGMCC 1.13660]MVQ29955.1 AlpA family phage regulatory protein [Ramlibacter pinisoli]